MTPDAPTQQHGLLLQGLDGSNPLAFLAALGTLRTLSIAWPDRHVKMGWALHAGAWQPRIHAVPDAAEDEVVETLHAHLCATGQSFLGKEHLALGKNLSVPPTLLRQHAAQAAAAASPCNRRWADFMASFGSEVLKHPKLDRIDYTDFCFLAGSGHQNYLETMDKLADSVNEDHFHAALFQAWRREDDKLGMRWDPVEAREYAHRWANPSNESTRTVWGANLLAAEATALYPTVPTAFSLPTTGFARHNRRLHFTWPLWAVAISTETVTSLVRHPELHKVIPDRELLAQIGVAVVWRSEKVRIGEGANYKWNLRPARAV